jgi:hypothetical protein
MSLCSPNDDSEYFLVSDIWKEIIIMVRCPITLSRLREICKFFRDFIDLDRITQMRKSDEYHFSIEAICVRDYSALQPPHPLFNEEIIATLCSRYKFKSGHVDSEMEKILRRYLNVIEDYFSESPRAYSIMIDGLSILAMKYQIPFLGKDPTNYWLGQQERQRTMVRYYRRYHMNYNDEDYWSMEDKSRLYPEEKLLIEDPMYYHLDKPILTRVRFKKMIYRDPELHTFI